MCHVLNFLVDFKVAYPCVARKRKENLLLTALVSSHLHLLCCSLSWWLPSAPPSSRPVRHGGNGRPWFTRYFSSFLIQRCGKRSAAIPRTLFPSLKVSHGIDIFFFPGAESGQQEHIFWPGFSRYLIVILISYLHWMMRNAAHYSLSRRKAGSLH